MDDDGPRDFPFEEMCKQGQAKIREGVLVYQKFTCSGCGARLMIEEPNVFWDEAGCEKCGTKTNIKEQGCNFQYTMMLHIGGGNAETKSQDHDRT